MARRRRTIVNERPPLEVGTALHGGAWAIAQALGKGERYLRYKALGKGLRPGELKEYFPARWARIGLTPSPAQDAEFELGLAAYFREALESARELSTHPGLVMTYDVFEEGKTFCAVYEWLEGESLERCIQRKGFLTRDELWPALRQIADAVSHFHSQGYLHRDISPDNVFLEESGKARLVDYETLSPFPQTRSYRDTVTLNPHYAPIELHSKFPAYGPESDVYALAATVYYALTGRRATPARLRISNPTVPPAFTVRAGISEGVSDALDRAMAVRARERTPTVAEFIAELGL